MRLTRKLNTLFQEEKSEKETEKCGNGAFDACRCAIGDGYLAAAELLGGVACVVHVLGGACAASELLLATVKAQQQKYYHQDG